MPLVSRYSTPSGAHCARQGVRSDVARLLGAMAKVRASLQFHSQSGRAGDGGWSRSQSSRGNAELMMSAGTEPRLRSK